MHQEGSLPSSSALNTAPARPCVPYPHDGPRELERTIEAALRRVVHPEIALTIVDAGWVYGVRVADKDVHVHMTMTSAACPVMDVTLADVEAGLDAALPPDCSVCIELVREPPWSTDRLSPRAKSFMGWSPTSRP
jgi:metal-sulfur cluster biosynthetic enzyme